MLRIVTEQHGDLFTLWLHGELAGEGVSALERYWENLARYIPSANVTIALSDVSFIDAAGEHLLERMRRGGAKLVASECVNKRLADRIRERSQDAAHIGVEGV